MKTLFALFCACALSLIKAVAAANRGIWERLDPISNARVQVSLVTGAESQRQGLMIKSIQDKIVFYGKLTEKACERDQPQFLVLPEVAHAILSDHA